MANIKHSYALKVEWLDPASEVKRFFKLTYFVRMDGQGEVELVSGVDYRSSAPAPGPRHRSSTHMGPFPAQFEPKNRKTFLKRIKYPSIEEDDLFIGAKLNMCVAMVR